MINNTRENINDEREKLSKDILFWSFGKEKYLNLISLPYSSSKVLLRTILNYSESGKKIVYITQEDRRYIEIMDLLRKYSRNRDYSYVKSESNEVNCSIKICNYNTAEKLEEKFDLVIYDDIRSFPQYGYEIIRNIVKKKCSPKGKIICFSIEEIFPNERTFELPVRNNLMPIIEPKVITTRIDISKDIPFVIYDYLKWSTKSGQKVVIYVPSKEKVFKVYEYLQKYKQALGKNIMHFVKDESDIKIVFNFLKMKKGIIVTNDFQETGLELKAVNIMVFFANDDSLDYKKLLYFCGKLGRSGRKKREEVLFLAKGNTKEIDKAKLMARSFNKEAWERGFLDI